MRRIKSKEVKQKKLCFTLFMILIALCFSTIKDTYAKYITSANGDANINIARWKILVNNQDITQNKELTNVITPIFEGNDNIASGVIAPTAEGYFDILIDATNTDVSLKYEITTNNNLESAVNDLYISGFSIDDGEKQTATTEEGQVKVENIISYDSTDKDLKLRIYIKWNDDEENGAVMDNIKDTEATTRENNLAKVNVQVKFIQLPNNNSTNNQPNET